MKPVSAYPDPTPVTRLLIVDDEPHIRSALVRALNLAGYYAEEAASGKEALFLLTQAFFDLIVLDLCLPDIEGVVVMQQAHQLQPGLLVVILTGQATLESAIAAVKSEAVDYLRKPAGVHEIIDAVTRALQKRASRTQKEQLARALDLLQSDAAPALLTTVNGSLSVGPLKLDRSNRLVTVNDEPVRTIALSRGETAVLASLMARPNHVLSCLQLVQVAWGYHADRKEAESVIRPYISRLRSKLEHDHTKPRLIRTVRRRGYLFSAVSSNDVSG